MLHTVVTTQVALASQKWSTPSAATRRSGLLDRVVGKGGGLSQSQFTICESRGAASRDSL